MPHMTTTEILKKVGATPLKTKTLLSGVRAGQFKVQATGSGYDFDQLREYQNGDDFRRIDWKSSARTQTLLLREYKDERSRSTHVLLDASGSMNYGSQELLLADVAQDLVVALFGMARVTDDDLALYCSGNGGGSYFGPRAGERHLMHLIRVLKSDIAYQGDTSLQHMLSSFSRRCRKKSLVFLISDFIDHNYETTIRFLTRQHEVAIIRLRDQQEDFILDVADTIACEDSERGNVLYSSSSAQAIRLWRDKQTTFFKQLQVPWFDCYNDGNHIEELLKFVRRYF